MTRMLLAIKDACGVYDAKAADKALDELRKTPWQQQTKELLGAISEQLLHSDFDEIVNGINKFIETHL